MGRCYHMIAGRARVSDLSVELARLLVRAPVPRAKTKTSRTTPGLPNCSQGSSSGIRLPFFLHTSLLLTLIRVSARGGTQRLATVSMLESPYPGKRLRVAFHPLGHSCRTCFSTVCCHPFRSPSSGLPNEGPSQSSLHPTSHP